MDKDRSAPCELLLDRHVILSAESHQSLLKTIFLKGNAMSIQEQKNEQKQQAGQPTEKAAPEQQTQQDKQAKDQGGNASPQNQK
ncbi:hypothetical protein [Pseudorhodoplanes sinuspersici]|uniref:hypothetical protein n=1 Tax=Pseudorhodoplanes sinuspersici TaxID=1235591 RepID=UPI0012FD35AB|nr:hypothetical protein [Pseudorhodoplanes sinuspersici]